jgi:hypothetical protein
MSLVLKLVGFFLLAAVISRTAEAIGFGGPRLHCACEDSCWCKRPVVTVFRWVTPKAWHRIGEGMDAENEAEVSKL